MPFDPYALTTWQLASLADCGSPDKPDRVGHSHERDDFPEPSPGATFLRAVAYDVSHLLTYADEPYDFDSLKDEVGSYVDSSVPIYTHNLWQTFVDLAAYQEDVSDYEPEDLTKSAQVALYIIGERLAYALLDDYAETIQPEEDEGDA